jgi:sugar phosphate isomerase/epimerase
MTANYIAREIGFRMPQGLLNSWGYADGTINERFQPIETFAERFDGLLRDIKALGFDALDLYTAHLHWRWATDEHLSIAQDLLRRHGLQVTSLAGGFGATPEELASACRVAQAVGTTILGGNTSLLASDRAATVATLKQHGQRLAIENHPEKTPEEILAKIGDGGDGTLGTAVDTGWYGTQGYDAAEAIERLGDAVLIVHLKDVRASGAHESCRYGEGVVPVEECVRTLQRMSYRGSYTVEHEPDHFDPGPDCRAMRQMLQGWLRA